jgi:hypothetical protein
LKILVCGGREFSDRPFMWRILDMLASSQQNLQDPITHLIHGNMRGADQMAAQWAYDNVIQPVACEALWTRHGPKAGPIRNAAMLELSPDVVIAFPGGAGTADMVKQSKAKGVRVIVATPGGKIKI